MENLEKVPVWFYVLAGVALLWNLLGAAAVILNFMMTPEAIASLPAEQQQLYLDTPNWSSYASLLAVVAGSLGCLALLIRQAAAYPLFILSIIGLVLQDIGIFLLTNAVAVLGSSVLVMQGFVMLIAIGLLFLAKRAKALLWLR
jgi:hypothetical protein